ncbi:MAG TPA: class I SAM-dependent methyltransferase [Solirubrobacterales bacterium]|nr:class I SAM-dependent methyltransferase [Solirubrobacterales bacterium]
MSDLLVRALGWRALMLHGDPSVWDRYRWLRPRLRRGGVDVLDAGAGNGGFAIFAARAGNRALGLSFSPGEMGAAERRAGLCGATSARFEVRDLRTIGDDAELRGSFDEIICFEVLEHLLDDVGVLRDLASALRPGGRVLITVPSHDHRPLFRERLAATEDGGHVRWGYSEEQLRGVARAAGLRDLEAGAVSGAVTQALIELQRRLGTVHRGLAWALTFPLRILQPLDRPLTSLTRCPYLSRTLVAEKP